MRMLTLYNLYISHETLLIIVKCTVTHYTPTLKWLAMSYTWGLLYMQIVFHFLMTVTWTNMTEEYHRICCIAHVTLLIIIKYEWLRYTTTLTWWWPAMPYTWGLLCTHFVTRHININSNQDCVDVDSMHPLHLSWKIADHSQMHHHTLLTNIGMTGNALHMRVALYANCFSFSNNCNMNKYDWRISRHMLHRSCNITDHNQVNQVLMTALYTTVDMMMTSNAFSRGLLCTQFATRHININSNQDYVDVNSMHPLHLSWNIADHSQITVTHYTPTMTWLAMPYIWGLLCMQIVFHLLMTVTRTNMTEEYHRICCIAHVTLLIIMKYEWLRYTPLLTWWWPAMPYTWGLLLYTVPIYKVTDS